ncbi:MAG: hypothetical protein M3Z27_06300 [Actinomycetota bacterium]|nr:hypothetical protein [Actinomycetota bacterium]
MYGLPTDFDPQIFVGRELETVTYAAGVIVLSFAAPLGVTGTLAARVAAQSPPISVSVSGSLPYRANGEADLAVDQQPVVQTSLVSLIGRAVFAFELKSPRELVLAFEGGGCLTLLDDCDRYEAYTINTGDREIYV